VPESRPRKKTGYTAPRAGAKPVRMGGRRWIAPAMVTCWVIGLAWIVVFYIAGDQIKYLRDLGNWNLLIGMGLIGVGFVLSTKWE
jgi:hypothetical protein